MRSLLSVVLFSSIVTCSPISPSSTWALASTTEDASCPVATETVYEFAPTPSASSGAPNKLSLKRDWRIDASRNETLKAEKSCKMVYTDDSVKLGNEPTHKTPVVWMTMPNMKLPTVLLQNSDRLQSVSCEVGDDGPRKIHMQFSDKGAFEYAWNHWHDEIRPDGDYLLITEQSGCWDGPDSIGERRFLRASSEERDDDNMSITCTVQSVQFRDVVEEDALNEVEFDDFNPSNSSSASGLVANTKAPGASLYGNETRANKQMPLRDTSGDSEFDKMLDYSIGKLDVETINANLAQYDFTLDDFFGDSDLPTLGKRGIGSRLRRLAKNVVNTVAKPVVSAINNVGGAIVDFAGQVLNDFFTFDQGFSQGAHLDTTDIPGFVDTPFNGLRGIELLNYDTEAGANIQVFCVECGASGDFTIRGSLSFSVVSGLQKAEVGISGNLEAALQVGFVGTYEVTESKVETANFEQRLVTLPLSPFDIPGVLTVGPSAQLTAGFDMKFKATGKLLAGAIATWGNIDTVMDLKDSQNNHAEGFVPTVTPVFEADGQLSFNAGTYLLFKLAVGVEVLGGTFEASAGLVNKPRLSIAATAEGEVDLNGARFSGDCKGIDLDIGFTHEVSVDMVLAKLEKKFVLQKFEGPEYDQCIAIGPQRRDIPQWNKRALSLPSPPSSLSNNNNNNNTTSPTNQYTSIITNDNTVHIRHSPNGNLYAVPESKIPTHLKPLEKSGYFASTASGSIIYGDSLGRMFHAYQSDMSDLGVSRLRLHEPSELPKTAWPVIFTAVVDGARNATAAAKSTLVVADAAGDVHVPVLCSYERLGVYPKIFLARDAQEGVQALMSNEKSVLARVTGEKVKQCSVMPLSNW